MSSDLRELLRRIISEDPLRGGCGGANNKTLSPGRQQRCTLRPTTFSSVQGLFKVQGLVFATVQGLFKVQGLVFATVQGPFKVQGLLCVCDNLGILVRISPTQLHSVICA